MRPIVIDANDDKTMVMPVYPSLVWPLVFVLFVSALKKCLEDINRKKMDTKVNNTLVQVWRDGAFVAHAPTILLTMRRVQMIYD